jgi:hypothetical protein
MSKINLTNIAHGTDFPYAVLAECLTSTATQVDIYYHTTAIPETGLIKIGGRSRTSCLEPKCRGTNPCGYNCPPVSNLNLVRPDVSCSGENYCDEEWIYYQGREVLNRNCEIPTIRLKNVIRGVDPMSTEIEYNFQLAKAHENGSSVLINPESTHWYMEWLKGQLAVPDYFTTEYPLLYQGSVLSLRIGDGLQVLGDELTPPHGALSVWLDQASGLKINTGMVAADNTILQTVARMDTAPPVDASVDLTHYLSTRATYDYVTQQLAQFSDYQGAFTYFSQATNIADAISKVTAQTATTGDDAIVYGLSTDVLQKGEYDGSWTWTTVPAAQITNGSWIFVEELLDHPYPDGSFPTGRAIFQNDGVNPKHFDELVDKQLRPDEVTIMYNGLGQIMLAQDLQDLIANSVQSVNGKTAVNHAVEITGSDIATKDGEATSIETALDNMVVTGATVKSADWTADGVTLTLTTTKLSENAVGTDVTLTLPIADNVRPNPIYRGSFADQDAIDAIPNPAFGQIADNQATATEWTYDGSIWYDTTSPVGTTPHTIGTNKAGIVTAAQLSQITDVSTQIAQINSRIDNLEAIALISGDTLDPNLP